MGAALCRRTPRPLEPLGLLLCAGTSDADSQFEAPTGRVITELIACTRAEFARLRGWPAFWIILGTWIVLNLVFAYLFNYLAYTTGTTTRMSDGQPRAILMHQMLPAAVPEVFTQGMAMFGGALMLVLGALVTGSGYGWGSWKTVLTQGSSRIRVIGGTMLALAAVVVALVQGMTER
jgi:hypothetical protein